MIELIITGETNKGKIALAQHVKQVLEAEGLTVLWPLEPSFDSTDARYAYAEKSTAQGDLKGAVVTITTEKHEKREITDLERRKGRSSAYWQMSAEEQWAEDKRLGLLDWDGSDS